MLKVRDYEFWFVAGSQFLYGEVTSLGNGSLNTVPASITGTGTFKPEFAKLLLNLTVQLFAYVN